MVKDGKLSRKGKTVTCVICKKQGHNKRSCKEKGTAGSQAASQSQSQAGKKRSRVKEVDASQAGSQSAAAAPKKTKKESWQK